MSAVRVEATALVVPFEKLRMSDVEAVGGKNASLGEMISQLQASGVRVPGGFATTAHAYREFLRHGELTQRIDARLAQLDTDDVRALAEVGAEIRGWIEAAPLPKALEQAIRDAFARLAGGDADASFAVRSSATAEDLPDASFAGQQETFLNVVGIEQVLAKIRSVYASLYNDRAISYRVHRGFAHDDVALSVGVQRMVRSDLAAAGVMFTLDTESGFKEVVLSLRAGVWARPWCRAPSTPTSSTCTSRRWRRGSPPSFGATSAASCCAWSSRRSVNRDGSCVPSRRRPKRATAIR
jgi:pyruvate,water dikinase